MKHSRPLEIAAVHPAFAGHFPDRPILPGVVLLNEAARLIGDALAAEAPRLWEVERVKFLQPALPGDRLQLSWETTRAGAVSFRIERAGRPLAVGVLRLRPA